MALDPVTQTKTELQQLYSYIRSREYIKIFANQTLNDFIEIAKNEIKEDGKRPAKLTVLKTIKNNINSIIDRAKKIEA